MDAMRRLRVSRLVRGSLAACVATFVALLSHVSAGGAMPGWIGIVVPLIISVPVCVVLAGRSLSAVRLALAVGISQALFHTLFVLGTFAPSSGAATTRGHVHQVGLSMPMGAATETVVTGADTAMWLAHAVAAIVTVAAVHRGEATGRRLIELARRLLSWVRRRILVSSIFSPPVPRLVRAGVVSVRPALSVVVVASSRRRGPPVVPAV